MLCKYIYIYILMLKLSKNVENNETFNIFLSYLEISRTLPRTLSTIN